MRTIVVALALVVAIDPARADDEAGPAPVAIATAVAAPAVDPPPRVRLHVNRWATGAFIVAGGLLWAGSDRVLQDTISPTSCRLFCEDEVNGFDDAVGAALVWDDDVIPQHISDGAAYVAVPVVAFGGLALAAGREGNWHDFIDDALVVGEATVVVGMLNRLVALGVGRTRPRTRYAPPGSPLLDSRQAHQSFFSGHTSAAFSVGVAAATVASLRRYRVAPWMWAGAIGFGALTGYMRLAGRDHWTTDVLVGATVATGLGTLVPRIHACGAEVSARPVGDGAVVAIGRAW